MKQYKNKVWLENQYITLGKSMEKIGKELKVAGTTIRRALKNLGIPIRPNNHSKPRIPNPKYSSLHQWVRDNKPRVKECEICHQDKRLVVANITGIYDRDFKNYKWICYKCHSIFDGFINNLKPYQETAI